MPTPRHLATVIVAFAISATVAPATAAAAALDPIPAAPPPEARAFAEETHRVDDIVAMPEQPGLPDSYRLRSRKVTRGVVYRNLHRARLFSFHVTKYWEYDGRRIRNAPRPRVRANVTSYGALLGWDYEGIISSGDHYYTWRRNSRSGHKSWRQGKFKHCPGPWGCFWKKYPIVVLWAHADGTYARRVRG